MKKFKGSRKMRRLICRHEWEYKINRHEWEYKIKPSKIILVQCRKCGKAEFHSKNKKYIFSKLVNRTYCWCPKCQNDLVRDSFVSNKGGIVTYRCSWCGHESVWDFGTAPVPILRDG